jgi:hypothetical protein
MDILLKNGHQSGNGAIDATLIMLLSICNFERLSNPTSATAGRTREVVADPVASPMGAGSNWPTDLALKSGTPPPHS